MPLGLPTREQSAAHQPDRARVRAAGPPRAGAAAPPRASLPAARVELGTEVVGVENGPDGVGAELRDAAGGERAWSTPATSSRPTARTARSAPRARHRDARAGPPRHRSRRCSARRCGSSSATHRYGLYAITHPEAEGHLPAGGPGRPLAVRCLWEPDGAPPRTREAMARAAHRAAPAAGLEPRIERIGAFSFAAQLADRFRQGERVPRRRRGAPGDAAGRHRDEHRHPRRLRPRLEARLGPARLGRAGAARLLRGRAPPGGRAQRRGRPTRTVAAAAPSEELRVDLGGRIAHVWLPRRGQGSTSTCSAPGSRSSPGPTAASWEAVAHALAGPAPVAVRSMDPISARALGIDGSGGLLARAGRECRSPCGRPPTGRRPTRRSRRLA